MGKLIEWVEATPDTTMQKRAAKLTADRNGTAHPAFLSQALLVAGSRFKKTLLASECERTELREERRI